jgi:hypothetical protein
MNVEVRLGISLGMGVSVMGVSVAHESAVFAVCVF